jgi:hypothetical protein
LFAATGAIWLKPFLNATGNREFYEYFFTGLILRAKSGGPVLGQCAHPPRAAMSFATCFEGRLPCIMQRVGLIGWRAFYKSAFFRIDGQFHEQHTENR